MRSIPVPMGMCSARSAAAREMLAACGETLQTITMGDASAAAEGGRRTQATRSGFVSDKRSSEPPRKAELAWRRLLRRRYQFSSESWLSSDAGTEDVGATEAVSCPAYSSGTALPRSSSAAVCLASSIKCVPSLNRSKLRGRLDASAASTGVASGKAVCDRSFSSSRSSSACQRLSCKRRSSRMSCGAGERDLPGSASGVEAVRLRRRLTRRLAMRASRGSGKSQKRMR